VLLAWTRFLIQQKKMQRHFNDHVRQLFTTNFSSLEIRLLYFAKDIRFHCQHTLEMTQQQYYMTDVYEETRLEKMKRKCKEEPFVPAGS
jgi:hypothetical protein